MTVSPIWIILGAVLLGLLLLLLLRVGVDLEYGETLTLRLRAGPLRFTLAPGRKKPPAKKKEKKAVRKEEKPEAGLKDTLEKTKEFLPLALDTAGRFRKKLRIDLLILEITVRGADPAEAGILYGGLSALLGASLPALENAFDLRKRRIVAHLDFTPGKPSVYTHAVFSLAVWQGLAVGFHFLMGYLKLRRARKSRAGTESTPSASPASS
ncbi:DUF2953 domain-containing protein [Papillibacter cinnamivorans]|uniref:DUF2953 domain-containing protein n=1 Tax=Papillibacter cinnamivorans DSM 12816 TaxID=1122930 RepID=A0A1W1YW08_9FIRM|nr:DUF2953 domain-containing protein [Papillibacter cinnamivorans]SMC39888.1 hypothetical protein SAMN02745168_0675 [Papillibacter cinnamivorans DSM 12816]